MMNITLAELFEVALKHEEFIDEAYIDSDDIYLDIHHFFDRVEETGYRYYQENQKSIHPLNLDSIVKGNYAVFSSCPQYPWLRLECFEEIVDVQTCILADDGYMNNFTGFCAVFHDSIKISYKVWYQKDDGQYVQFSKSDQRAADNFSLKYPQRQLEWITKITKGSSN